VLDESGSPPHGLSPSTFCPVLLFKQEFKMPRHERKHFAWSQRNPFFFLFFWGGQTEKAKISFFFRSKSIFFQFLGLANEPENPLHATLQFGERGHAPVLQWEAEHTS